MNDPLQYLGVINKCQLPAGCGIVTCGQRKHFPGVQLLCSSLAHSHINLPVIVWEIFGSPLTLEQRRWCDRQKNIEVRELAREHLSAPASWKVWWQKPAMLKHSPFERTLWIDADVIVLSPLLPIFTHIETHPFFVLVNEFQGANDPRIYNYIPVMDRNEVFSVNTSLCAFDVNDVNHVRVVDEWIEMTMRVSFKCRNPQQVGSLIHSPDEGTLRLALQNLEMTSIPWYDTSWSHSLWYPHEFRTGCFDADISHLRHKFPDKRVIHFPGMPKPWAALDTEFLDFNIQSG